MQNELKQILNNKKRNNGFFHLICFFSILFIFFSFSCKIDDTEEWKFAFTETMMNELNSIIQEVPENPLDTSDDQLDSMASLKDARIVGLGEATHGTKEFFQMKFRIFKYLVENHGFKILGIEADFAESIYIDKYITTGEGDLRDIMQKKMWFWTWKTEEVYELLEWMRQYNIDKPKEKMLRYMGFDCQHPAGKSELLIEYLNKVSPQYLMQIKEILDYIPTQKSLDIFDNMSLKQYNDLMNELNEIYDYFVENEAIFIKSYNKEQYIIAKQLIRTIIQSEEIRYSDAKYIDLGTLRDKYMAENAMWLPNLVNNDTKVALWAHNAHLANGPIPYGNNIYGPSMGKVMKDTIGENYKIIGFSFSSGFFRAFQDGKLGRCEFNAQLADNSINSLFHQADHENFIFSLDKLESTPELNKWFSHLRRFISIGAAFYGNMPRFDENYFYYTEIDSTYFNFIIHYDTTNETIKLAN